MRKIKLFDPFISKEEEKEVEEDETILKENGAILMPKYFNNIIEFYKINGRKHNRT